MRLIRCTLGNKDAEGGCYWVSKGGPLQTQLNAFIDLASIEGFKMVLFVKIGSPNFTMRILLHSSISRILNAAIFFPGSKLFKDFWLDFNL